MVEFIREEVTKPLKSIEIQTFEKRNWPLKCFILTSKACSGPSFWIYIGFLLNPDSRIELILVILVLSVGIYYIN